MSDLTALDSEIPFASVYSPLVVEALATIDPTPNRLLPGAVDDLGRQLVGLLSHLAGRAFLDLFGTGGRGTTTPGRYHRFVAHLTTRAGQDELRSAFPVVDVLIDDVATGWGKSTTEFLERLDNSRELLARHLDHGDRWGPIARISTGLGDPHRGGRSVCRAVPAVGDDVVYKPRPMAGEVGLYEILGRVLGDIDGVDPIPWAVDCGTHGWMRWINTEPITDNRRYALLRTASPGVIPNILLVE